MRSSSLDSSSVFRYPGLDSRGSVSSREFLGFSLDSFANWNCQNLLINSEVELQIIVHFFLSLLVSCMSGMTFLPQKFTGSDERGGVLEFPSDNVSPLVKFQRQITMTLNPFGVGRIHDCLAGRPNCNGLSEFTFSWSSDPSNFRRETFNMLFFQLKSFSWDKHREICVLDSVSFDQFVKENLNFFPNRVSPRSQNVTSRHVIIVNESGFNYHILIPSGEISGFLSL